MARCSPQVLHSNLPRLQLAIAAKDAGAAREAQELLRQLEPASTSADCDSTALPQHTPDSHNPAPRANLVAHEHTRTAAGRQLVFVGREISQAGASNERLHEHGKASLEGEEVWVRASAAGSDGAGRPLVPVAGMDVLWEQPAAAALARLARDMRCWGCGVRLPLLGCMPATDMAMRCRSGGRGAAGGGGHPSKPVVIAIPCRHCQKVWQILFGIPVLGVWQCRGLWLCNR
jgi:hypothetical protein